MIKAKNKLGLVLFPAFDWAISPTHPEREERLLYTKDQLEEEGIVDIEGIEYMNPVVAEIEDIQRVHFCVPSVEDRLTKSHLVSVGGAIRAAEEVYKGNVDKSFAMIRPPGHHAHKIVYGDRGFCVVNVEAIMIERLRLDNPDLKVAIVDSDCHHGDGTQNVYWNDKNTLFISFHQDGRTMFPGTGATDELGGPSAYGYNINVPLPPNTGEEGFDYVTENVVLPILDEFKPDLIVNSAGQDNHYTDPLTNMNFTAQGYAKLTEKLDSDIAVLEGGYSIQGALPYVNLGIILAMAGLDYSGVVEPDYDKASLKQSSRVTRQVERVSKTAYNNWENKEQLAKDKFGDEKFVSESKQIYYDTDGIMENQTTIYQRCDTCTGLEVIKSSTDKGAHVVAIKIARDCCHKCIDTAHKLYKEHSITEFTNVYLQDKKNDKFYSKSKDNA